VVSVLEKVQADLVIVDALADAFAGDENNRQQPDGVNTIKSPSFKLAQACAAASPARRS
jgi:hypothetical protein